MRNSWSRNLLWGFSAALLLTVLAGCKTSSKDAAAPLTISGTPSAAIDPGKHYRFVPDVAGDDTNNTELNFTIQNKPTWMGLNSATGELSGTPTAAETGIYADILISVTKGTVSAALPAFSVTVAAADSASGGGAGGTATLSWSPPTTNSDGTPLTDLAGYRIYYGLSHSAMVNVITTTNTQLTSYQVTDLVPAVWYFEVKAYNSANVESDRSPIVSKTI